MSNKSDNQSWEKIKENISIALIEPEHPGNIGSTARAMNNMGLDKLVLVNPVSFTKETYWLAHASESILEKALILNDFTELLNNFDYLIATSNRGREEKKAKSPEEAIPEILNLAGKGKTAIVFGRENKGLYNSELFLCRSILKLPAYRTYPSLNLAQAVMVTVYELYKHSLKSVEVQNRKNFATEAEKDKLVTHFEKTLDIIRYYPTNYREHWKNMTMLFRNFLNSGEMESKHIRMMHKYFNEVENYAKFRKEQKD